MPSLLRRLLLAAVLAQASVVAAAEPAPGGYRVQVLTSDAVAFAAFAASAGFEGDGGRDTAASDASLRISLGLFVVGGPAIHAAHGRWGRATISAGLRLVLPILGAGIATATAECRDPFLCGLDRLPIGLVLGALAASAADVALLAGESVPEGVRPRSPLLGFAPAVYATARSALMGVGGRF